MSEKTKINKVGNECTPPGNGVLAQALKIVGALSTATTNQRLLLAVALSAFFACTPPEPPDDGHISQQMIKYALATGRSGLL